MWKLPKPETTAREAFDVCIEGIQDKDLKDRIEGIRQQIDQAEIDFNARGTATELHLIAAQTSILGASGDVTKKEMEQLYDRHMARQKSRGQVVYNKIMAAAEHGQCPFCGHLPVSTLDHSLAKARHPALAVTPINLIPSCKDCNHNKGTADPDCQEAQFIHAYYDDLSASRWLRAQIVESSPPGATFFVNPPDYWDETLVARANMHFEKLKLKRLYSSQAGRQLQNIRRSVARNFAAGGAEAVRADLIDRFQSNADVSLNSWEGALYEAASQSDWYCNGGFNA